MRRKYRVGVLSLLGMLASGYCGGAQKAPVKKITIAGTLTRVMAIGGESTGWEVHLDAPASMDAKDIASMQVKFNDPERAEKFENKHVQVSGTVEYRRGVETGDQPYIDVASIRKTKAPKAGK